MKNDLLQWYLSTFLKVTVIFAAFYLFLMRSWVGEDAFIFFKYVDNFVNHNGLVFNIGERVEGFTAPLWVFVLSAIRFLTQIELRPVAIILGLLLSTASVVLLILSDKTAVFFPLVPILMITNSAFRDFSTSGFETSLTYILLIFILVLFKRGDLYKKPILISVLTSLLILNRPEAVLITIYFFFLVLNHSLTQKSSKPLLQFILPMFILVGGYQIFRMGYYASLLPNTFYAKRGGSLYLTQGYNYLRDFVLSYQLTSVIYFGLTCYTLFDKKLRYLGKHFLILTVLLAGYVFYAGGDYMHGRSLLMAFIVLSFGLVDSANAVVEKILIRTKLNNSLAQVLLFALAVFVGYFGIKQTPITKKIHAQINNINDERSHFGVTFNPDKFSEYLSLPITGEFGWRDRGLYYKELAEVLDHDISVVNWNIGYFGYASGDRVNVMGGVLIDPYMSRLNLNKRGKIGHENSANWDYVLSRKPTFSYTPFKYWNENAHFKWEQAPHAFIVKDDTNDSFVPIFDLSNSLFLDKFSSLIGKSIKSDIDTAQRKFLLSLSKDSLSSFDFDVLEYLGFLKVYWYPYASIEDQKIFDARAIDIGWAAGNSVYEKFIYQDQKMSLELWSHITNPLNFDQFITNISYSAIPYRKERSQ